MSPTSMIVLVVSALAGYLLGSINSSLIVGKFFGQVDVRQHGSGNAGATNTLRTLGKKAAVLVVIGDLVKGILAVVLGAVFARMMLVSEFGTSIELSDFAYFASLVGGLACIIGHNWPVFFGFKGGKGVVTSAAVVMSIDIRMGAILVVFAVAIIAITRYVSLGSLCGALLFPVLSCFMMEDIFGRNLRFFIVAIVMVALIVFRHKANISRLIAGTESKLGQKKKDLNK